MMKRVLLGVLFFGTVWGASEAMLGGALYAAGVPRASVPLTIIGFCVLTAARAYLPWPGSATLIASCAMLYKFLNNPFFACHLLGVLLLGVSYDLVFGLLGEKRRALSAAAATYLGYALFGLLITYVFRYSYWAREGLPKIVEHVVVGGTMAAAGNALLVPLVARVVRTARAPAPGRPGRRVTLARAGASLLTAALWALCLTVPF
ncbi:MAG: hypothetical protein ACOC8E_07005 [Planctomycetota bacterium]